MALAASSDDNDPCYATGQTCNGSTWNNQKRTHRLSNNEVIWDLAGNVSELMKDHSNNSYGSHTNFSQITTTSHTTLGSLSGGTTTTISRIAKNQFGPSGDYTSLNSRPHGGLGYGYLSSSDTGIFRGGSSTSGTLSGVFYTNLHIFAATLGFESSGFRCTYHPE